MSFHFYLYRAEEGLPAMNRWAELRALPLGSVERIRIELTRLFPQLEWQPEGDAWLGFGSGYPAQGPYLDIILSEDTPGQCHFVVLNKAPPSVMRKIMEALGLNYVCAPETGDLVDPYAYADEDRYYAKRAATAASPIPRGTLDRIPPPPDPIVGHHHAGARGMPMIVQAAQQPLRLKYKDTPESAMVVDHARTSGSVASDPFHSVVEPMDGCGVAVPVGVHAAVGGLHDAPTPGDLLCAALAACQDSAVRMVANLLGVELLRLEVRVTATVDVRGTMGMSTTVPVGFQSMTCDVQMQVKEGTPPELLQKLQVAAERCCVVQQTLKSPPAVQTRFGYQALPVG